MAFITHLKGKGRIDLIDFEIVIPVTYKGEWPNLTIDVLTPLAYWLHLYVELKHVYNICHISIKVLIDV